MLQFPNNRNIGACPICNPPTQTTLRIKVKLKPHKNKTFLRVRATNIANQGQPLRDFVVFSRLPQQWGREKFLVLKMDSFEYHLRFYKRKTTSEGQSRYWMPVQLNSCSTQCLPHVPANAKISKAELCNSFYYYLWLYGQLLNMDRTKYCSWALLLDLPL